MKKKTTVGDGAETRRGVIINRPFISRQRRCEKCAEASGMLTPVEAAHLCRVSRRTLYRWLKTGAIHSSETVGEGLAICLNSLAATTISPPIRQSEANSRIKK